MGQRATDLARNRSAPPGVATGARGPDRKWRPSAHASASADGARAPACASDVKHTHRVQRAIVGVEIPDHCDVVHDNRQPAQRRGVAGWQLKGTVHGLRTREGDGVRKYRYREHEHMRTHTRRQKRASVACHGLRNHGDSPPADVERLMAPASLTSLISRCSHRYGSSVSSRVTCMAVGIRLSHSIFAHRRRQAPRARTLTSADKARAPGDGTKNMKPDDMQVASLL